MLQDICQSSRPDCSLFLLFYFFIWNGQCCRHICFVWLATIRLGFGLGFRFRVYPAEEDSIQFYYAYLCVCVLIYIHSCVVTCYLHRKIISATSNYIECPVRYTKILFIVSVYSFSFSLSFSFLIWIFVFFSFSVFSIYLFNPLRAVQFTQSK